MAKQSALGANLYLGVYDLTGDVGAVTNISSPRAVIDVTGLDKQAPERLLGRRDGSINFAGFWNTAASQIVAALSAMPTSDVLAMATVPAGSAFAVGDIGCALNGKQLMFDQARGNDGSLGITTHIQANGSGLEWGRLLTAGKASVATGTVNQTGIDHGASTAFGGAAYLHVFSIASGTMGVKLQDSADNVTYNDLTGGAFTNVAAPTAERIVLGAAATVNRYVRLVTTGVHGTAVMAVLFVRYLSSQSV